MAHPHPQPTDKFVLEMPPTPSSHVEGDASLSGQRSRSFSKRVSFMSPSPRGLPSPHQAPHQDPQDAQATVTRWTAPSTVPAVSLLGPQPSQPSTNQNDPTNPMKLTSVARAIMPFLTKPPQTSVPPAPAPTPPPSTHKKKRSFVMKERFSGWMGSIKRRLSTRRQGKDHDEFEEYMKFVNHKMKNYREVFFFLIMLVSYLVVIFLQRDALDGYMMERGLSSLLMDQPMDPTIVQQPFSKSFSDLAQFEDLRDWFRGVLVPLLTNNVTYSGRPRADAYKYFIGPNRMIGGIRLRQLRVVEKTCPYNQGQVLPAGCYRNDYTMTNAKTEPFGPSWNTSKYQWTSQAQNGGSIIYSRLSNAVSFDGSGYVVDVPLDSDFSAAFDDLINDEWWDYTTRAIIISMNFLNPTLDKLIALNMVIEMPGSGLIFPYAFVRTFRLFMYQTRTDFVRSAFEGIFIVVLLYFIYREVKDLRREGFRKFFSSSWNIIDTLNICLFLTYIGMYLAFTTDRHWEKVDLAQTTFAYELQEVSLIATQMYQVGGFNILLSFFKIFKFLSLNDATNLLWRILGSATGDILRFMFIFAVIIMGFMLMGMIAFPELDGFKSIGAAFGTCVSFLIGSAPDYEQLEFANRVLGPVFFVAFVFFVFFVIANMLVAILTDAYSKAKLTSRSSQFSIQSLKKSMAEERELMREAWRFFGRPNPIHFWREVPDTSMYGRREPISAAEFLRELTKFRSSPSFFSFVPHKKSGRYALEQKAKALERIHRMYCTHRAAAEQSVLTNCMVHPVSGVSHVKFVVRASASAPTKFVIQCSSDDPNAIITIEEARSSGSRPPKTPHSPPAVDRISPITSSATTTSTFTVPMHPIASHEEENMDSCSNYEDSESDGDVDFDDHGGPDSLIASGSELQSRLQALYEKRPSTSSSTSFDQMIELSQTQTQRDAFGPRAQSFVDVLLTQQQQLQHDLLQTQASGALSPTVRQRL